MTKEDEAIRQIIRSNLKRLREEAQKTQSDIAKMVGKSENAVGSWEQGLSLPDIVTLIKLAKFYGKTLDYMYKEEKDAQS